MRSVQESRAVEERTLDDDGSRREKGEVSEKILPGLKFDPVKFSGHL